VKPNGTKLIAGFLVKEAVTLLALTASGTLSEFSSEGTPIDDRRGQGKQMATVERGDAVIVTFKKPLPTLKSND